MNPLVGIVMGSASDRKVMQVAEDVLKELEIGSETRVLSAHRTPEELRAWVADAEKRGVKVFIAAAGGAAHLAGSVAAQTVLPVIGVPLNAPFSIAGGLDALLSTVQMPGGIPVACVTIGEAGAQNAAILAAEILGTSDAKVADRVRARRKAGAAKVLAS